MIDKGSAVKLEVKDLQTLELERLAISLSGQNGSILLANHGHHIYSIRYLFNEEKTRQAPSDLTAELYADEYRDSVNSRRPWESINETNCAFILHDGDVRIEVDKSSGVVTAFWKDVRSFGGQIGNSDTVLPRYPLRVQDSGSGPGKFNFKACADDIFIGLGEKSGKLDKNRRRFKMFNRDALGYEAMSSDPLYKSIPFFLQANRKRGSIAGIYFPHPRVEEVDFRVESNYYLYVRLSCSPYGYVLFLGENYRNILDGFTRYTGRPALPPRFSFGYFGSSMSYAEPADAATLVTGFFNEVERRKIPCEGMYLSSGYVKAENGERYTFLWNKKKFPDPKSFMEGLKARGYRLCCNIKPGILSTHPDYHEMEQDRRFISYASGDALVEYYWGNSASLIDFSRAEVREWWKEQLKKHFIRLGVEGIWNDNNEFEIEDESVPLYKERSLLPLLMLKASYEALSEERPGRRPWIISRSGYAGMQRYARTWTGDNVSDEESMVASAPMGMNLGLSGVPFYGHDIGGFFGDSPSHELLLRWSQLAVFQPRFVMHSWNPNGKPTEPWTYPEVFESIRDLIRLRYRYLPYIYSTAFEAALYGTPMERPLWLEFREDPGLPQDSGAHMVGDALLVIPPQAVAPHDVEWRFPSGTAWVSGMGPVSSASSIAPSLWRGGQTVRMPYPDRMPLYFFRTGSAVVEQRNAEKLPDGFSDVLELSVFPLAGIEADDHALACVYEDDGVSCLGEGSYSLYTLSQRRTPAGIVLANVEQKFFASNAPEPRMVRLSVPSGFTIRTVGQNKGAEGSTAEIALSRENPVFSFEIFGSYGSIVEPQRYEGGKE